MFIHTNQPLLTFFYIKKVPIFCLITDESACPPFNFGSNIGIFKKHFKIFSLNIFLFKNFDHNWICQKLLNIILKF